jgi:hypothetical protein
VCVPENHQGQTGAIMNTSWGNEEDMEIDDEFALEIEHLVPSRQRNHGDIGTLDFYDRQDRLAREIADKPR